MIACFFVLFLFFCCYHTCKKDSPSLFPRILYIYIYLLDISRHRYTFSTPSLLSRSLFSRSLFPCLLSLLVYHSFLSYHISSSYDLLRFFPFLVVFFLNIHTQIFTLHIINQYHSFLFFIWHSFGLENFKNLSFSSFCSLLYRSIIHQSTNQFNHYHYHQNPQRKKIQETTSFFLPPPDFYTLPNTIPIHFLYPQLRCPCRFMSFLFFLFVCLFFWLRKSYNGSLLFCLMIIFFSISIFYLSLIIMISITLTTFLSLSFSSSLYLLPLFCFLD